MSVALPSAEATRRPRLRVDPFVLLAAPGLLYLAILFALPLAILLFRSFQASDGTFSIA